MAALSGVISNLRSWIAELLPPSSSSSTRAETHQIEPDLKRLMEMLGRIKATLYEAEEREIRDLQVKLWLKELKGVAYDAEDVLGEYRYEVLRAQVEARNAFPPSSRERKQVQMPDDMFNQIKQIKRRFDDICKDRIALRLFEEDGPRRCNSKLKITPTSHFVVESDIIGRRREKEKLIDVLSSDCHEGSDFSVVTIVGTGGIGKTTLAQLAYNDRRIRQRFHKFGWVCVSEDFDVERLTRKLVESITGSECDLTNLDVMQEKISEVIKGKRVLLVLDDVWNENRRLWELFRAPFVSAALVKILVTTRNEPVARIMQTVPTFNLDYLSEEQCWQLFHHYAFGGVNQNESSELVEIGNQIIKKCGRLPLAIKSIASLLRHEAEEENWREILESELWESDARNDIFPPLQISYARLPTYLKPCFLYCSMFPKDYHYSIQQLVSFWISQGYIESNGKKSAEKIGWEYAKELWDRSLFEGGYRVKEFGQATQAGFKLHDMVHDLTRFLSENECYSFEPGKVPDFPKELYHLYVGNVVEIVEPLPSGKFTALRTLILGDGVESFISTSLLSKIKKLRALDLQSQCCGFEFLSSTVNLKHLRYLSLQSLYFTRLPECICSLYNLQKLTVRDCRELKELPKSIGNLVSIEELVIHSCNNLRALSVSFCQLKALTKLRIVFCGTLEELPNDMGNLNSLRSLEIKYCPKLQLPVDELLPVKSCDIEVCGCPGLKGWCLQHSITYKESTGLEFNEINASSQFLSWRTSPLTRAIKEEEGSSSARADAVQVILKIYEVGGLKYPELVEKVLKLMQLDPGPFVRAIKEEEASSSAGVDEVLEILKIYEMGGLMNHEGVEKIMKLMQLDRTERKINLTCRVMVAHIIATFDGYVDTFLQMRGFVILEEWLQEAQWGPKQGEYSDSEAVEELLLALLRALNTLPIGRSALRTSTIGKSIRMLKHHRSLKVQGKARDLDNVWNRRLNRDYLVLEKTKNDEARAAASLSKASSKDRKARSLVDVGKRRVDAKMRLKTKNDEHELLRRSARLVARLDTKDRD